MARNSSPEAAAKAAAAKAAKAAAKAAKAEAAAAAKAEAEAAAAAKAEAEAAASAPTPTETEAAAPRAVVVEYDPTETPKAGPKGGVPRTTVIPAAGKRTGKVIVRVYEAGKNPRRPGTYGRRAFEYYAPNVGEAVDYESFRVAVERDPKILGALNHLDWDEKKGFIRIEDKETFLANGGTLLEVVRRPIL